MCNPFAPLRKHDAKKNNNNENKNQRETHQMMLLEKNRLIQERHSHVMWGEGIVNPLQTSICMMF